MNGWMWCLETRSIKERLVPGSFGLCSAPNMSRLHEDPIVSARENGARRAARTVVGEYLQLGWPRPIYHYKPRGEPRLELDIHVFGIMWNYSGIH